MAQFVELVPDAAERFFRMAEADTTDRGARYDRLADSAIRETRASRQSAVALMLVFTAIATVFFALGNNLAGGLLLSVPVIGFLNTLVSGVARTSRRSTRPGAPGDSGEQ